MSRTSPHNIPPARASFQIRPLWFPCFCTAAAIALVPLSAHAGISLAISPNSTTLSGTVNADYSSTHLFIDEINGDSIPITIFFDPGTTGVDEADVFTNLNNRDKANLDANNDGIPDAISPPNGNNILAGDTTNYFAAYKMNLVSGGYQITLNATKTGAYRLTARYHLTGEPATTWHWYGDFQDGGQDSNGNAYNFRDAAIVVSPTKARSMNMYELNVLNVDAESPTIINPGSSQTQQTSTDLSKRSTFVDLYGGPGATTVRPWNLDYAKNLGVNWLWLQPIHPIGDQGRQTDPNTGNAFTVGSPYAVKNFFAVNPLMSKSFVPGTTSDAAGRAAALTEFQGFVSAADAKGINIMLDVPFNHTSFDCEIGDYGQQLFGNGNTTATTQFWNLEARVYSRWNGGSADQTNSANYGDFDYGERAFSASSIALASDRFDFGKFVDVHDVYFGRYAALVTNSSNQSNYLSEADWFDYSIGNEGSDGSGNGHFDGVTQNIWRYFAWYIPFWLQQTGHTNPDGSLAANSILTDPVARRTQDDRGLDGIRADFAQGLPPQLWEYIVNYSRSYKWDFVFLAESLDGHQVTYRSGRHFDVLNENVIFDYYSAQQTQDFRNVYDGRRTSYGQAMVLWDTESHDEAGYSDPYQALIRYACSNTIDGTPDIFFGQEIGISGAVTPTNSNPSTTPFGFSLYQVNFGKPIPQFMTPNSLAPAWNALGTNGNGQAELYPVYSAIGQARTSSPALQSSNRYYLNATDGSEPASIFGVAKYATANASPNASDVVLAFVNLDRNNTQTVTFNVNITQNGSNLFGFDTTRTYNVKNIAADLNHDSTRNNIFLWGNTGRTGSDVLQNGVFVSMNPVPSASSGWTTAPYEAQYLKVYDITAPVNPPAVVSGPYAYNYSLGGTASFSWGAVAPDSKGITPVYTVTVTINGTNSQTVTTSGTSYAVTNLTPGQHVSVSVVSANPYYPPNTSPTSTSSPTLKVLDPNADDDGDGTTNLAESTAGTNPMNSGDYFHVTGVTNTGSNSVQVTWASKANINYQVESTNDLTKTFAPISPVITGSSASTSWTDSSASDTRKFYHVKIVTP